MPPASQLFAEVAEKLFPRCHIPRDHERNSSETVNIPCGTVYADALDPSKREIRLLTIHPLSTSTEVNSSGGEVPPLSNPHKGAGIVCSLRKVQLPVIGIIDEDNTSEDSFSDNDYHGSRNIRNLDLYFTALSYVWGDPTDPVPIIVNGVTVPVTHNLASALQHIRKAGVSAIMNNLWVDAICINQADIAEKSHQVQMMADIYAQAVLVISWFGQDIDKPLPILRDPGGTVFDLVSAERKSPKYHYESAAYAFDLATRVAAKLRTVNGKDSRWLKEFPDLWKTNTRSRRDERGRGVDFETFPPRSHKAFLALKENKLFTRGWIFQESVLAVENLYLCGDAAVFPRDLLACEDALNELLRWNDPNKLPQTISTRDLAILKNEDSKHKFFHDIAWIKVAHESKGTINLLPMLSGNSSLQTTDPRDQIYCMLGVMAPLNASCPRIEVDYSKSAQELYTEVVEIFLHQEQDLKFLSWAGTDLGLDITTRQPGLPSWAPDWAAIAQATNDLFIAPVWPGYAVPGKYSRALAACIVTRNVLKVFGFVLDLGKLSTPLQIESEEDVEDLILKSLQEDKCKLYPTGIPLVQAIARLFMDVCSADWSVAAEQKENSELDTSRELFSMQVDLADAYDTVYVPPSQSPSELSDMDWDDEHDTEDIISFGEVAELKEDANPAMNPTTDEIFNMLLVLFRGILESFPDATGPRPSKANKDTLGWSPHDQSLASYFQQYFVGDGAPVTAEELWGTSSFPHERWRSICSSRANIDSNLRRTSQRGNYYLVTEQGYIGMSTCAVQSDTDILAILPGYRHVAILRSLGSPGQENGNKQMLEDYEIDDEEEEWLFVGSCTILGFMKGEAFQGFDGMDDLLAIGRIFMIR